jgi:hypothetical protein
MKKILFSLALVALISLVSLAVTQTGSLIVTIMSEEGQPLAGAQVTISSTNLMGVRTLVATGNGKVTFRNLPPGEYTATVIMDGFKAAKDSGIVITIQKVAKAEFKLQLGEAREVITVVEKTPLVDTTSNTVSTEFSFDQYLNHMPTGRHYVNILGMAGGVQGGNNPSVLGATGGENLILFDGVATNDAVTQGWGNQFNVDTIEDVQVAIAGITAEYGRMQGSVVNMVTKSGSNELHGIARLTMTRQLWNDLSLRNPATTADDARMGSSNNEWAYSGGGPLYPDMIWWYVGYLSTNINSTYTRYINPATPTVGMTAYSPYTGHYFNIKGTIQLGEDFKISGFYSEDPIMIPNNITSQYGTTYFSRKFLPEADGQQFQGGWLGNGMATYVVSDSMFLDFRYSMVRGEIGIGPQDAGDQWSATKVGDLYTSIDGWYWGDCAWWTWDDRDHDAYAGSINYLLETESIGSHEIKIGVDYVDQNQSSFNWYPAGENRYITDSVEAAKSFNVPLTYRFEYLNRFTNKNRLIDIGLYVQDSAQISDALTLNLGLRADPQSGRDNYDDEVFSMTLLGTLAPRFGLVYALGENTIHLSVGRYVDQSYLGIMGTFNYSTTGWTFNRYSPTDGFDGRNGWTLVGSQNIGAGKDTIDSIGPDFSAQYADEVTAGFSYSFTPDLAANVNGFWRIYKNLQLGTDRDGDTISLWENLETAAYGTKYREYMGIVIDFTKRPTEDNLFLTASATLQSVEGMTTSTLSTGGYYDNPLQTFDNAEDWWGKRDDPSFSFKIQAVYQFLNGWYAGVDFLYQNGFLYSTTRTVALGDPYGNVVTLPNGRGDMERTPWYYPLNIQLGYETQVQLPFAVPFVDGTIGLAVYGNVRNVLDCQVGWSKGVSLNSPSTYNKDNQWYVARNYVLGFRIEL